MVRMHLSRRARRTAAAGAPAAELRVQLPRLWPDGPDGPVDVAALRSLSRAYARSGRTLEDLFDDVDQLCDVVGIGTPSRVLEACGVAWSDAFLDTVDPSTSPARPDEEALREIEQQLGAQASPAWRGLPDGRLLVVGLGPGQDARAAEEVAMVAAEVRVLFPRSPVAGLPDSRRVLAAVVDSDDLEARLGRLAAYCAEHLSAAVSLEARRVPGGVDEVRGILRAAG